MAGRQNKVGLDYFDLDCHMDDKIKLIEAEYGLKGFAIVVKLYQSIYAGFGYYCEWTPDTALLWAMQLGISHGGDFGKLDNADESSLPGFPKNLITNVVSASIRRGIFSEQLFNKYHILTSSGIQKRYLNATSKREKVEMKKEYLLISVPENRSNVVINSISDGRNSINVSGNEQSREEKSRVEKYNKARDRTYYSNEALNQAFSDYVAMRKSIKKPMTDRAIELAKGKLRTLAGNDDQLAIRILNQSVMNSWLGLFPIKDQNQKQNTFNKFEQRSYSSQELDDYFINEVQNLAGGGNNDRL